MFRPEGIYPAMLTPFDDEGRVNETELRRYVDWLIESGLNGLFCITSVGESIHLGVEEKMRLMSIVVDQAAGRVPVTPGVGDSNSRSAIRLARHAQELGCPAVVVPPPHFFPVSDEIMERYYLDIDQAVDVGLILYNIPLFSTPISREVFASVCGRIKLAGMKDSSGSMVDFMNFINLTQQAGIEANLLTGREETLLATLAVGGKGCMTVTSGVLPEVMTGIYQAWQAGDLELARQLQYAVLPFIRAGFSIQFPMGFKIGFKARGFDPGPYMQNLPQGPGSDYERAVKEVRAALDFALERFEALKG